ncbi:MAG: cation transporter [Ignavibacteria bacterium]|nr:cation transporter [Ignavibacteria bacterium]
METGHHHQEINVNRAFKIGIILNLAYIALELSYGIAIDSMALIADAGHNFSDVLSLALAWGAVAMAKSPPTSERTYGLGKGTILAAFLNSLLLLVAIGAIIIESIRKFSQESSLPGTQIIIVASIGVLINGATAMLFVKGKSRDINLRGAYLHMLADAGISFGVVIAGILINITGFYLIDSITSIIIAIIIFIATWKLLKESFFLTLDSVPKHIDFKEVASFLKSIDGVKEIHDLHIWPISSSDTALSVHLVVEEDRSKNLLNLNLQEQIEEKFAISHSTIQVELNEANKHCLKMKF